MDIVFSKSRQIKLVVLLGITMLMTGTVFAQDAIIFFQITPPYNQSLEVLKDQMTMTITVPGQDSRQGFLSMHIFNNRRSVEIQSNNNGHIPLNLEPGANTFSGSDLDGLIDINKLNFIGVDPNEVLFGDGLPIGRYYICFELFDATGQQFSNTACTKIQVNLPPVVSSMSFVPPYNTPFGEYQDQLTINFNTPQAFDAVLEMNISGFDGAITITKRMNVQLETGTNIFSGLDLDAIFSPGNFSILAGITEQQLINIGLPENNYMISFSLLLDDEEVTSTSQQFRVPATGISMNVQMMPAFDEPLENLLSQSSITILSTGNVADAYITMEITGDNFLLQTDQNAVTERLQLEANIPAVLRPGDLINITGAGVNFEGSVQVDPVEHGLPEGNYSVCFQLWNSDGQLLTEIPSCFSMNVPRTIINLSAQAVPPFISSVENIADMLMVNISASRDVTLAFTIQILGDNGVSIVSARRNNPTEVVELEKNIPQVLGGVDLLAFFDPDLLIFSGTNRNDLFDFGLPAGNYQICLTPYAVDDYPLTNAPQACTNAFPVNYVEPPQLLTPECGQEVDIARGQFILFNWLPSPGAPLETEYTLKIVEMRIRGQNPNDALLSSTVPSFFEETIMGNSYLYGPGDPLLEPGLSYAYQVFLTEDLRRGQYINRGLSQACYFSVKDSSYTDDVVPDFEEENVPQRKLTVVPIMENEFVGYNFPMTKVSGKLRYKFIGDGSIVFASQTSDNQTTLSNVGNSGQNIQPGQGSVQSGQSSQSELSQQTDISLVLKKADARKLSFPTSFNEDNTLAAGSLPLGGVNLKLIEGYIVYGNYLGENASGAFVTDPWGHTAKTIATTTTDSEGNFEFAFIQSDSLGLPSTVSPMMHSVIASGTLYKVYRLVVESPYYCSPEMNIVVQPWEHLDVGTLVSYVKSYELKVITKTGATGAFFADQQGGVGTTIPGVITQIKRPNDIGPIPDNEGQNLDGALVSEDATDANGAVVFTHLVRHFYGNPLDKYTITCATNENFGEYNFIETTKSYPELSPSTGPYSEAAPIVFNSEWQIVQYEKMIIMYPKLPRVFGEVNGVQAPAELPQNQQTEASNLSASGGFSRPSTSNRSTNNLMSTSLYQSGLSMAEFSNIYQQIPNWSEMVNKAPLPNVDVHLWEINNYWQTNNTPPVNKLQKTSDSNGQFTFDKLDLEITPDWKVDGPARVFFIEHPGYKKFVKAIPPAGYLKWGQQYEVDDILLEPDGFVFGYVQNEKGDPVKAEVFIGEFTSATTVQSQEFQNILGITGDLKELFIIKAPSGGNVKLHIVPEDPIYVPADYWVNIDENNSKIPQNLGGFDVGLYKHRILLEVTEEEQFVGDITQGNSTKWNPPIKNVLVRVTNLLAQGPSLNNKSSQPQNEGLNSSQGQLNIFNTDSDVIYGYTDDKGFVTLSFTNNAQEFEIEVIPPTDMDLVKKTVTISSEPSGKPVYAGKVVLEKAWSISGTVTYGSNATPLPNARVYIDDDLEVFTNSQGKYSLKYIPQKFSEYSVTAENHDNPLTLIAETKNVQLPISGNLDFNLTEFTDFEIKELMGIPVTVTSITPDGNNYLLDGAFINLPGNQNFSAKEEKVKLKFHHVPITSTLKNGKLVAKAVNSSITLDESELDLINYTKFITKQTPLSGYQLSVSADGNGLGSLIGKVILMNSSFQFDEHYMSFNEETSSDKQNISVGQQPVNQNYMLASPGGNIVTDNLQRSYIDLFNDQSQFRLFDKQQNTNNVKTLTAAAYPLQPYGVTDQNNQDYQFKVQDFKAVARKEDSYVYRDSLVLATTLIADQIPLAIPKTLEVDAGNIVVSVYGFEQIIGGDPLTFKLEQWQVICDNWTLNPNVTGIQASTGKINFGLFTTEIQNIKILPNDLQLGGLNMNKFKLGDIVPITLKANTTFFGIDNASGADNAPHWMLSVIGFNNEPAASIKGLPGMIPTDEINMQEVQLLSNGEQKMVIGNQDQWFTFYNIIKVKPDKFTMLQGGLQLSASLDLEIPLLQESYGSFRYTKENNEIVSQFLGMDVDFTMPGNTMFVGNQQIGEQTLEANRFEAIGYVKHEEKVKLFSRLEKNLDSTFVVVDPLHQTLLIADDGSNYMAEVTGGSRAIPGDWNKFVFSGDLTGMKGVEDAKKRKTFTINGSINAENEGLDVKNISADFGGMKITYDFQNDRLTGSLDFQQNFSSVQITGHADFLTDKDGWLFIAGGSLTTPGFGTLKAGLGIGDYGNMSVLIEGNSIEDRLLLEAKNKNLPPAFQNGFSGFFFTGMKDIPQLSVPETGFDFLFVSGSLELVTGFDARVWMGFDDSGAEFGIGVMAFAELTLMLDVAITCTELYGYLGLELLVQGMYNTGNGVFSLDGCASITLAGAVEQCFPVSAIVPIIPPVCEGCGTTCDSLSVKATMHFDSDGNIDAGFALGSCSGGNPLSQEIKEKFNCN